MGFYLINPKNGTQICYDDYDIRRFSISLVIINNQRYQRSISTGQY
jgi:hypothetical protein